MEQPSEELPMKIDNEEEYNDQATIDEDGDEDGDEDEYEDDDDDDDDNDDEDDDDNDDEDEEEDEDGYEYEDEDEYDTGSFEDEDEDEDEDDTGGFQPEYEDNNNDDTGCFEGEFQDDYGGGLEPEYKNDDTSWFKQEYKDDYMGSFEQQYCCFPLSHIDKSHLEDGNRIIMPLSALDRLSSIKIEYPLVFEILNPECERASHCGVLEFSADEGFVFLPEWMTKNLQLYEGQLVTLKSTTLSKGTYLKIQPHSMKFLGLSDPKAVLEKTLRDFSCLTVGDTILLNHDNNKYYIDILEAKPSSAISVIETDIEVDIALALDYTEPEKKPKATVIPKREAAKDEEKSKEETKLIPFTGVARRLDAQPTIALAKPDSVSTSLAQGDQHVAVSPEKLVSGAKDDVKEKVLKKDEQKFQAFTGKKHTITG